MRKLFPAIALCCFLLSTSQSYAQKTSLSAKLESYGMVKDPRTAKILIDKEGELFYTNTFTKNLNQLDNSSDENLGPIEGLNGNKRFVGVFLYRYEMINGQPYALVVQNTKETGKLLLVPMNLRTPKLEMDKSILLLSSPTIIKVLSRISAEFSTHKKFAVFSIFSNSKAKIIYAVLDIHKMAIQTSGEQSLTGLNQANIVKDVSFKLDCSIQDDGETYVLLKNYASSFKNTISLFYYHIDKISHKVSKVDLPIKADRITDISLKTHNSNTAIGLFKGEKKNTIGLQVFELNGIKVKELVNQNFTPSQQHQIDKNYGTAAPKKVKKIKIYTMKMVDMVKHQGKWNVIGEQHYYYDYEGRPMDNPLNTTLFILGNETIEKIVTVEKEERMNVGSTLATSVWFKGGICYIITSGSKEGIVIGKYDMTKDKLTRKIMPLMLNGKRLYAKMNHDMAVRTDNSFVTPVMGRKGIYVLSIKFD